MDKVNDLKPLVRPSGKILAVGTRSYTTTKQPYNVGDTVHITDSANQEINVAKVIEKSTADGWHLLTIEMIA